MKGRKEPVGFVEVTEPRDGRLSQNIPVIGLNCKTVSVLAVVVRMLRFFLPAFSITAPTVGDNTALLCVDSSILL